MGSRSESLRSVPLVRHLTETIVIVEELRQLLGPSHVGLQESVAINVPAVRHGFQILSQYGFKGFGGMHGCHGDQLRRFTQLFP